MGRTFVTIDDEHGFWMRDATLELWLRLLALHMPEPNDHDTKERHATVRQIRDRWLMASQGGFMGCVPHRLEDVATLPDGLLVVRQAIDSLMQSLEKAPKMLDVGVLNLLGICGGGAIAWKEDFEAWRLLEVGHAFIGLLEGKITGTASTSAFMPGFRSEADLNQRLRGHAEER
jgi:hypothetical protein